MTRPDDEAQIDFARYRGPHSAIEAELGLRHGETNTPPPAAYEEKKQLDLELDALCEAYLALSPPLRRVILRTIGARCLG